ncbi:related to ABC transporter family members [Sporisorium reilianum f. sp. reilianum]|uniref:Related to ABC transporter family members n=1 Tax=Sporisorium reilianum f. sp. reilianum TaxID=72559 RepID=A0A2N8UE76_9BASI|nr:related to ABC transporter family members [Sporisorium reilianum f. sp. reilianum]
MRAIIPCAWRAGARRAAQFHPRASRTIASTPSLARFNSTQARPPLLKLQDAQLKTLASIDASPLHWTVNDAGTDECWAIIAPASEQGGAVRRELIDILAGRLRPRRSTSSTQHPPVHPFLSSPAHADAVAPRSSSHAIKHVSFATKMGATSSAGDFTNYAARYGAIREEDRVTLYERLMELLDCPVGLVAATKLVPDPFAPADAPDQVGRFKYASDTQREAALAKAQHADKVIRQMAPLLLITDELLHRPVIALSNGQTRRARILSSLITGAELVVLEEPFSGIDVGTRQRLGDLFAQLHAGRRPRLVLVLREQDAIPDLVTHVLTVDDRGSITWLGPRHSSESDTASPSSGNEPKQGGHHVVLSNARAGIGQGDASVPALIALHSVSIQYGDKVVLDNISLSLHPGVRLVLAGDNGSGKTTLLALLLGDHPKSFSFRATSLSLFSHARDHPSNARALLNRRMGHLSPELFNAFPRKPLAAGGLTVGEVVASGFENVFARRSYSAIQRERVWAVLQHFADLIKTPHGMSLQDDIQTLSDRAFAQLSHGSQAVVLFLRAVVGNPQVLVLDEPFQGMDRKQVLRARAYIDHPDRFAVGRTEEERRADCEQRRSMAVVLVSHYESEWPTSFGALLRLSEGRVVERI